MLGGGPDPDKAFLVNTEDWSMTELGRDLLAISQPVCLGAGRGALYQGIGQEHRAIFVEDITTGSLTPLFETSEGDRWFSAWLPDTVLAPVWNLQIPGDDGAPFP